MLLADELKAATEAAIGRARHRAMESVEICKQLDLRGTSHLVKFIRESDRAAQGKQRVAIKKETREIYARNVGNPNRDIDENAAEIFSIYCEAWTLAGKKKSAAFIRFVRDARILPLITSQSNGVLPYLRSSALRARTKQRVLPASFGMLRKEWHDKLDTEALKVELLDSAQSDVNLLANRRPVTERRSPDATFAGRAAPVDGQNGAGAQQSPMEQSRESRLHWQNARCVTRRVDKASTGRIYSAANYTFFRG